MYQYMAVQAVAGVHLCPGSRIGQWIFAIDRSDVSVLQVGTTVDLVGVITAMAILTEPWRTLLEQRCIDRSVRRMAVRAIVDDWTVFPKEGTAFFGVTGVAGLVDRALEQQVRSG